MAFFLFAVLALVASCHAEPASYVSPVAPGFECKNRNGYYPIEGNCDSYWQCRDYHAATSTCPDGLHFSPDAKWPEYPCRYPSEVSCMSRSIQSAKPTAECPHQYGYFPSPLATPEECGHYRLCIDGKAIEMECSAGLAFNPASQRCDWPDLVPSCKADEFLGFSCPPAPLDELRQPLEETYNYKYPDDCYSFFSCEYGKARLLSCDSGFAFDPAVGRCVDEDYVQCEHHRA